MLEITLAVTDRESAVARTRTVQLAEGATVRDALLAAGLKVSETTRAAVFGRSAALSESLSPGDRVDAAVPLWVDPMQARRLRAERRGQVSVASRHGSRHQLIKPWD